MKASTLRYFLYPYSRKTQQTKTCLVLKCLSKIPATSFPLLSKCLQSSPTSNYLTKRACWPLRVCRLLPNNFNLSSVASTSLCPRLIMVLKHVGGSSNIIPFFFSKDTPLKEKSTKHLFCGSWEKCTVMYKINPKVVGEWSSNILLKVLITFLSLHVHSISRSCCFHTQGDRHWKSLKYCRKPFTNNSCPKRGSRNTETRYADQGLINRHGMLLEWPTLC